MFYVYVLRSRKTGRRYVGSCENVEDRLQRHSAGHSKATATVFHRSSCTAKAFSLALTRHKGNGITKREEGVRNSID
jgi:hypothetical protein